ncbi:MAG: TonB-dependent receptor [Bdellovibrio sp.]
MLRLISAESSQRTPMMIKFCFIFASLAAPLAWSQNSSESSLSEITVLGDLDKKSSYEWAPSVSTLSGAKWERLRQPSLGESLRAELGVQSSFFGPQASRPIIRGMDGDRIRILHDGLGVLDASAASQDHAVAIEPLTVEKIEIVRGSAALLYGSSAVGGVVQVTSQRIPQKLVTEPQISADLHSSSVDEGKSGALSTNFGVGSWAFHFDASTRESQDYQIPGYASPSQLPTERETVPNSAAKTSQGSFGTSYVFEKGYTGASYSLYDSTYGTIVEESVKIKMKQEKVDFAVGMKDLGWVQSLSFKHAYSDYQHKEMEGDEVGTVFTNRGHESRLEIRHPDSGPWKGLFGLQSHFFDFSATGEESFLPDTQNQNLAAFLYEEAQYGAWAPSFGVRFDYNQVQTNSALIDVTPNNPGEAAAGGPMIAKVFHGVSASTGTIYSFNEFHSLALNWAYTERAPNYQELFANGPHLATDAFERGDNSLDKEKSHSVELSYRYQSPSQQGSVTTYVQDFTDYIALSPQTGGGFDPEGSPGNRDLALYQFEAVNAQFLGAEMEFLQRLPLSYLGGVFELGLKIDMVRAKNKDTGNYLPRIPPLRETLSFNYIAQNYRIDTDIQHIEKQTLTAPNESETSSYTLVHVSAETPLTYQEMIFKVYARVQNLFNEEARDHLSIIKDRAPLPGRNIIIGVKADY